MVNITSIPIFNKNLSIERFFIFTFLDKTRKISQFFLNTFTFQDFYSSIK